MQLLKSYLGGQWVTGTDKGATQTLFNPSNEQAIAELCVEGLDFPKAIHFARKKGRPALANLTLAQRGKLLGAMAAKIHQHRPELLALATKNGGNTRGDAKFDVDGASSTLAYYAKISSQLGDARYLVDGDAEPLGSSPRLAGRHVYMPRPGIALLINAFNFPAWGFGEKAACALLAGMPVIVKPATSTALVAHRIVELVADLLPEGALTLVCGSAHALPSLMGYGDVIAFTGSSRTAGTLAKLPAVLSRAVRLSVEADSLNAAVLGPDVENGTELFDLFIKDVAKEITQKAGQKCTAIRRIFVGEGMFEAVRERLVERLLQTKCGDPATNGVRMGPVASAAQHRDVKEGIERLCQSCRRLVGDTLPELHGVSDGKGYFVAPTLLESDDAATKTVHDREVFGPVATLLKSPSEAEQIGDLLALGKGGLVCSIYTDDRKFAAQMLRGAAPHHGRLVFGSSKIAGAAIPPGAVMPQLIHGGPGRAGGGEELGGWRGVALYSQHTAVQGDRAFIDAMIGKP